MRNRSSRVRAARANRMPMRRFYPWWAGAAMVQPLAGQLAWGPALLRLITMGVFRSAWPDLEWVQAVLAPLRRHGILPIVTNRAIEPDFTMANSIDNTSADSGGRSA